MKKCLIWGNGSIFRQNVNMIRYHEMVGHFKVIGITSKQIDCSMWEEWACFAVAELRFCECDFIIVMAQNENCREIMKEAIKRGVPKERIFTYRILQQKYLNIERLVQIRKAPLTIFSNNCWGGLTYHSLDMEFFSPLINMAIGEKDFITFLKRPYYYMMQKIEFTRIAELSSGMRFPQGKCDDIILNFLHYKTFEEAEQKWEKRKERINWNNLFIEMATDNKGVVEEFMELPFENKICFVPFESNEKSLVYIPPHAYAGYEGDFRSFVNKMARGVYPYYDVHDLIEYGALTVKKEFEWKTAKMEEKS